LGGCSEGIGSWVLVSACGIGFDMMDKPFVDVLLDVVPEDFVDAGI
jgi:hypothetical protein